MSHSLGPKGQVVIEKKLRDQLGVGPGWRTIQRLVGDRVEIRFIPPEHDRSLFGSLAPYIRRDRPAPSDEEMDEAVERGIIEEWRESNARTVAESTDTA